ncbi:phosphoenolpyruvate carboxylase kinase 2-like [Vigna umbellata]|uniref:phosphoenolpyruvate carboxylase kinase 2-like n=1 Tax=Vigna umbellata TaxID=87088 RepID=UPI001F5EA971|nr:phosphoenolpyruvate carboxylase kinase 2-like [Vigna umbellata]
MCEALKTQYQVNEEIGRGRFTTIFRCFHPLSNKPYACKVIDKSLLADSTDRECLQNEPKFMTLLSPHPNILQIFNVFEDDDSLSIVMDLCQPHTLFDHIVNDPIFEIKAIVLIKSLLESLAHCHRMGVAHYDIKPDNVLFDSADNLLAIVASSRKRRGGEALGFPGLNEAFGKIFPLSLVRKAYMPQSILSTEAISLPPERYM